jgi:hypothetical protein
MKLKLALASTLLALGATTAQAADTRTPDILSSVSSNSVQSMSAIDAAKARGEYLHCTIKWGSTGCNVNWSKTKPKYGWSRSGSTLTYNKHLFKAWGYYVAR